MHAVGGPRRRLWGAMWLGRSLRQQDRAVEAMPKFATEMWGQPFWKMIFAKASAALAEVPKA
ncbi:MAG: hypothetical protein N2512_10965 [Armatimonadetes bacterium]|nr:hypothetical protein [Armatimonadota bacterium]